MQGGCPWGGFPTGPGPRPAAPRSKWPPLQIFSGNFPALVSAALQLDLDLGRGAQVPAGILDQTTGSPQMAHGSFPIRRARLRMRKSPRWCTVRSLQDGIRPSVSHRPRVRAEYLPVAHGQSTQQGELARLRTFGRHQPVHVDPAGQRPALIVVAVPAQAVDAGLFGPSCNTVTRCPSARRPPGAPDPAAAGTRRSPFRC